MFTKNKYYIWYYNIINKRQSITLGREKGEHHHIIPRSLGGTDDCENIVKLTTREHFVCHLLLVRMTEGVSHYRMKNAVSKFMQCNSSQDRVLNSRQYALCRKFAAEAASFFRTGSKRSAESIAKGKATVMEKYGSPVRAGAILSESQKEHFRQIRAARSTYETWFVNADPNKKKNDHSNWAKKHSTFVHNNPSSTEEGKLLLSRRKSPGIIVTPFGEFSSRKDFENHPVCNQIGYENVFYLGVDKPIKTRAIRRANLPIEWKNKSWREVGFYIIASTSNS